MSDDTKKWDQAAAIAMMRKLDEIREQIRARYKEHEALIGERSNRLSVIASSVHRFAVDLCANRNHTSIGNIPIDHYGQEIASQLEELADESEDVAVTLKATADMIRRDLNEE